MTVCLIKAVKTKIKRIKGIAKLYRYYKNEKQGGELSYRAGFLPCGMNGKIVW